MKVAIAQPTYLPWLGYFDLIDQVDAFVILDNVQFEKQSWQQRNRIKTPTGLQWLTVPVSLRGRFGQLINEVEIRDDEFWRKHLRAIELNYRRASFFVDFFPELNIKLSGSAGSRLLDLNVGLIAWFMRELQIRTPLLFASRMNVAGKRTELLANICTSLGATEYISPVGSASYLLREMDLMTSRSIEVRFHNYEHPRYQQMFPPFIPYASILDLLFNEGGRSPEIMRSGRRQLLTPDQVGTQRASKSFNIEKRPIGPDDPVYIVAELSANHNQDFDRAVELVHAAKRAGADAIKLQTYTPDTITINSDREYFRIKGGTLWDGRTLHDLYAEAHTPWEWQPKLKKIADELDIHFFSSPFDATAVEFLESINVPAYKLASCELIDLPLIEKLARTGKPLIFSTGMATAEEIEEALATARNAGATQIALLKCTSAYPAPVAEMNLRTIPELARRFALPVGLSDHTPGIAIAVAAVSLGACIIEKHLTISRSLGGPDAEFSLEPHEFKEMVGAVRLAEMALGAVQFGPTLHEESSVRFRRSLFVVRDMKKGELFSSENLRSVRPGDGLHTRYLPQILGKHAARQIERGTPMNWDLIADDKAASIADAPSAVLVCTGQR